MGDICCDQPVGGARRGVLDDADAGRKCAYHQLPLALGRAGERAQTHAVACLRQRQDRRVVGLPGAQARLVGQLGQPPAPAAVHQGRWQCAALDASKAGRQQRVCIATGTQHALTGGFQQQFAAGAVAFDPDRQHAGTALLPQQPAVRLGQAAFKRGMGAAYAGMAGKGNLLVRRENAHAITGPRVDGRQQKGGFDQCGPACEALHRRGIPVLRADHHAQVVAASGGGCEHVQMQVAKQVHAIHRAAGGGAKQRMI